MSHPAGRSSGPQCNKLGQLPAARLYLAVSAHLRSRRKDEPPPVQWSAIGLHLSIGLAQIRREPLSHELPLDVKISINLKSTSASLFASPSLCKFNPPQPAREAAIRGLANWCASDQSMLFNVGLVVFFRH